MNVKKNPQGPDAREALVAARTTELLARSGGEALAEVDARIAEATGLARWEEAGLWHRVRFRLMRLQQEQALVAAERAALAARGGKGGG